MGANKTVNGKNWVTTVIAQRTIHRLSIQLCGNHMVMHSPC